MAIRFDKNLNREIKSAVDAYNKRVERARLKGLKYLPSKQSTKQLKQEFASQSASRRELRQRLKELERFNSKSASTYVELPSGEKTSKFNLRQAILRRNRARRSIERKLKEQQGVLNKMSTSYMYIGSKQRFRLLENIRQKLLKPIFSKDTIRGINAEYGREFDVSRFDTFYENYFDILDQQVKFVGYDQNKYQHIKDRLSSLKPDVLLKIKENEPHINAILVYYKEDNKYNEFDRENLDNNLDYLYNNIDEIIAYYNDEYEIL